MIIKYVKLTSRRFSFQNDCPPKLSCACKKRTQKGCQKKHDLIPDIGKHFEKGKIKATGKTQANKSREWCDLPDIGNEPALDFDVDSQLKADK